MPSSRPLQPWLRTALGLLLALLSAGLLLLSMPPLGLWPLAVLGFAPMLVAQHRLVPARLSSLASALAIGGFLGGFFLYIFGFWADQIPLFRTFPAIIGAIVLLADMGSRRLHERTGYRWFVLQGALVWMGIEMIRNLIPAIGTSGFIGYAFYRAPWLIQPVSVFGIFGLDLLIMMSAYAVGLAAIALYDARRGQAFGRQDLALTKESQGQMPRPYLADRVPAGLAKRWLIGVGLAAAVWTAASLAMYFAPEHETAVRVAAVQPVQRELPVFEEMTQQAAAQGAKLVVWPEGALHFDPRQQETERLASLARETGMYIATGYALMTPRGQRNEATVISPAGEFLGTYGKDHPLSLVGETSVSRGAYPAYQTALGALGTIICYDLQFNDSTRRVVRNGAQILAVPSNDWPVLTGIQTPYLKFRAIENRAAAVKADSAYDSVVIDARGRVVAARASTTPAQFLLVADVRPGTADSLYLRLGDWLGWLSLAGLAFFALPNPLLKAMAPGRQSTRRPSGLKPA